MTIRRKESETKEQAPTPAPQALPQRPRDLAGSVLDLQRRHGNEYVRRLLRSKSVQAKLKLSDPGDASELEADRVADQVLRMPAPDEERDDVHAKSAQPQVLRAHDGQEESAGEVPDAIETEIAQIQGGGQPLPPSVRGFFEPRFGQDFGNVRIHTDARAAESAKSLGALAYTVGDDVVFGEGQYAPESSGGKHLLAHELTHVVQQGGSVGAKAAGLLSREPEPGPVPTPDAPKPSPAADSSIPPRFLTESERLDLLSDTRLRIGLAFTAFGNACKAHQDSIKAEAKADAELFALIIDIVTGFAAPVFASLIIAKLAARVGEKALAAGASAINKDKVVTLISQTDKYKATFTGVTKAVGYGIKAKSMSLFGETDIDQFSEALRVTFHEGAATLSTSLGGRDDAEILSVWAAYDPEFTNEVVYKNTLKAVFDRYRSQVRPIGSTTYATSTTSYTASDTRAVYMDAYGKVRLALIHDMTSVYPFGSTAIRTFVTWVSPDMEKMAVEFTKAKFGKVEKIDPGTIKGHIPDPHTGK